MNESTEVSVASTYCVVYVLRDRKWEIVDAGWTQLHLYRDSGDGSHRLVGWTLSDSKVVINANVSGYCQYQKKSDDFHKFKGEDDIYGFGFYHKAEAFAEAEAFMCMIQAVIREVKQAESEAKKEIGPVGFANPTWNSPLRPTRHSMTRSASSSPDRKNSNNSNNSNNSKRNKKRFSSPQIVLTNSGNSSNDAMMRTETGKEQEQLIRQLSAHLLEREQKTVNTLAFLSHKGVRKAKGGAHTRSKSSPGMHRSPYRAGKIPLGKLKIGQPRIPGEDKNSPSRRRISRPYKAIHSQHVNYDSETRTYLGLPPEWQSALNKQFGVPLQIVEARQLPAYASRIPCILCEMKEYLLDHDGLFQEGVFRVAPDSDECSFIKHQLDQNEFKTCEDIHCISNLIKVFFRDLPVPLLESLSAERITAAADDDSDVTLAGGLVESLPEPQQSVCLWLLDLCIGVWSHTEDNKMHPQSLGIVIGPNLWNSKNTQSSDPMEALRFTQKVAAFLHKAIVWRHESGL